MFFYPKNDKSEKFGRHQHKNERKANLNYPSIEQNILLWLILKKKSLMFVSFSYILQTNENCTNKMNGIIS